MRIDLAKTVKRWDRKTSKYQKEMTELEERIVAIKGLIKTSVQMTRQYRDLLTNAGGAPTKEELSNG